MPANVAKRSKELFGVWYKKQKNKNHVFFYCSECNRDRRTDPVFFPEDDGSHLVCSECYMKLFEAALQKKQKEILLYSEVLPKGTKIHLGKKGHKCKKGFEEVSYYLLSKNGNKVLAKLSRCRGCGEIFDKGDKYNFLSFPDYDFIREDKYHNQKFLLDSATFPYQVRPTDFLTRMSTKRCIVAGHDLLDVQAQVKVLYKDYTIIEERIPATYCKTCEKYFILETDYQLLKNKGTILCNVVEETYWSNDHKGFYIVNNESLLFKMGYNVNAINNLDSRERQKILGTAMINKMMTRTEVLSHLDYLIRRSQGNVSLANAVNKWKEDRAFVRNFQEAVNTQYVVNSIRHRNYKKK